MSGLINILRKLWAVSDKIPPDLDPEYIIVHSYGLVSEAELPDAEMKSLSAAYEFAQLFSDAKIVMASSNYFWPGCVTQEDKLKILILRSRGIPESRTVHLGGVANTLEEINKLKQFLRKEGKTLLIIVDQLHARSVRAMYRDIYPEARIFIFSVMSNWDNPHSPLVWGRTNWRWFVANFIRHFGYLIFGDKISGFRHPLRRI